MAVCVWRFAFGDLRLVVSVGRCAGGLRLAVCIWLFAGGLRAVCGRFADGFAGGLWFVGGLRAVFRADCGRFAIGCLRAVYGQYAVDGLRADCWRVCGQFVVCGRFAVDGFRVDCWRVCGQFVLCGQFAGGFPSGLRFAGGLRAGFDRLSAFGGLRLAVCVWRFAFGGLRLAVCVWRFAFGGSRLAVCVWRFAFGGLRLAVCVWRFAFGDLRLVVSVGRCAGGLRLAVCIWLFAGGLRAVCGRFADGFAGGLWFVGGLRAVFRADCGRFAIGCLRAVYGQYAVDGLRADCWRVCGQFVVCGRFAVDGLWVDCWRVCGQFVLGGQFAGGFPSGLRAVLRAVSARFAFGGLRVTLGGYD